MNRLWATVELIEWIFNSKFKVWGSYCQAQLHAISFESMIYELDWNTLDIHLMFTWLVVVHFCLNSDLANWVCKVAWVVRAWQFMKELVSVKNEDKKCHFQQPHSSAILNLKSFSPEMYDSSSSPDLSVPSYSSDIFSCVFLVLGYSEPVLNIYIDFWGTLRIF